MEQVEITAELLDDMKAKGLISREHMEHILVSFTKSVADLLGLGRVCLFSK